MPRLNERIMQRKNVVMNHAHIERLPNMTANWGCIVELRIGLSANPITVKYQAIICSIKSSHF